MGISLAPLEISNCDMSICWLQPINVGYHFSTYICTGEIPLFVVSLAPLAIKAM